MPIEDILINLLQSNLPLVLLALLLIILVVKGVKIVPQSEQHVVERFGRLRAVMGPGINMIVPFIDKIAHKISILERQLPTASQDAITRDNVLVQVDTSVFYGKMDLDEVQSNRTALITTIKLLVEDAVDNWGIEVTRAEILDVNLDAATRAAMMQQLNAERARRAQVTEAEGNKRAVELAADAELYASEQTAKARRVLADAEAYATQVVATAIGENGLEAAQYQIALKQVEALNALGAGAGNQTIVVPAQALEAFGDAFKLLKGRG